MFAAALAIAQIIVMVLVVGLLALFVASLWRR